MTGPEQPKETPRLVGWLVAVGAIVILGVWLFGSLKVTPAPAPKVVIPVTIEPTLEAATEVLRRYFESPDDAGRIGCLHEKERVAPLWQDFHHRRAKPLPMLDSISSGEMVTNEGRTLAFFTVVLSPGGSQPIALFWEGDRFAIDWESHVAYGTMDWIEWVEAKPSTPQLMRVYLSEIKIGEDGAAGKRIALEHRDSLGPVVAEVSAMVDFPIDFSGRQRVPVTAEFQFQGSSGNSRLVLTRLVHEGWSR